MFHKPIISLCGFSIVKISYCEVSGDSHQIIAGFGFNNS